MFVKHVTAELKIEEDALVSRAVAVGGMEAGMQAFSY
jgi:hypothetical protein